MTLFDWKYFLTRDICPFNEPFISQLTRLVALTMAKKRCKFNQIYSVLHSLNFSKTREMFTVVAAV